MPFRKAAKITIENLDENILKMAYQVDYALTEVGDKEAYFHAQFRRSNPLPYKTDHVILEGVKGWGQYVGTYLAWGVHNTGWWGEGEIKFFIDGDQKFPTIAGTGTEDYIGGAYDFDVGPPEDSHYQAFTTPYSGLSQIIQPDGHYKSQERFGMYRWHISDPVRFEQDLKVTIQALGWRADGRYLPLQDDISSVAYWYQTEPHATFPKLPSKDQLEIR
jgi:D-arabinan exo alpha-(1,3)/(1,5)-arabinofuranosidase (non-reducing end)